MKKGGSGGGGGSGSSTVPDTVANVASWTVSKLKSFLKEFDVDVTTVLEKSDLVQKVRELITTNKDAAAAAEAGAGAAAAAATPLNDKPLDLRTATAADIATHVVDKNIAQHLRGNVPLMEQVFDLLRRDEPLRANRVPPVSMWITAVVDGNGTGPSMMECLATQTNAVCGKHFRVSDIAFKCLDCGADPTCVMCAECFKTSPCQQHNYKMVRSGGGMCDCGDETAWKKESFCARHKGLTEADDPSASIPADQRAWIYAVLRASMRELVRLAHYESDLKRSAADTQLSALVGAIAERFHALISLGDCAKRVVVQLLMESQPSTLKIEGLEGVAETSALEQIILLDTATTEIRYWDAVVNIVLLCVSDPMFKTAFSRLLCRHLERLVVHQGSSSGSDKRFLAHGVQVFTVPTVVDELMNPAKLGAGSGLTIMHRFHNALMYAMSLLSERSERKPKLNPKHFPTMFKISVATNRGHGHLASVMYHRRYALVASRLATSYQCTAPALMRALCLQLEIQQLSSFVYRADDDKERLLSWELELVDVATMWHLAGHITEIANALDDGRLATVLPPPFQFLLQQCGHLFPDSRFNHSEGEEVEEDYRHLIARASVADAEGAARSLVPPGATSVSYLKGVIAIAAEFLNGVANVCQKELASKKYVTKSTTPDGPCLRLYDLIHAEDAVTFNLPLVRFFALAFTSVLGSKALEGKTPAECAELLRAQLVPPETASTQALHDWADMVLMLHVVRGQIRDALWKRNHMNIAHQEALYSTLHRSHFKELDHFFLQVIVALLGPSAFAYHALQRFSFLPQADRLSKKDAPLGYPRFLHLVLTLICDDVKSSREQHERNQLRLRIARHLSQKAQLRSDIVEAVGRYDLDDDSKEGERNEAINKILHDICTVDRRKQGNFYRLKPTEEAWQFVTSYNVHFDDNELAVAKKEYAMLQPRSSATGDASAAPKTHGHPRPRLPAHHPLVDTPLRMLLHDDNVHAVAIFALVCFGMSLEALVAVKAAASGGAAAAPKPDLAINIPNSYLSKSVDLMYLACEEVRLSQVAQLGDAKRIDWSLYDLEQRARGVPHTFAESCTPLPEIRSGGLVHVNLQTRIFEIRLHALGITKLQKIERGLSAVDVLRLIVQNAHLISDYDIVFRARAILIMLAVVEDDAAGTSSEDAEAARLAEEKARKIKDKQKAMMERMKKKQQEASTTLGLDAGATTSASSASAGGVSDSDGGASGGGSGGEALEANLHTKLIMASVELECCFCQSPDATEDDPLLMLAHVATSCSMATIYGKPDPAHPAATVLNCGHAAHFRCIQKHFEYLEPMRRGDMRTLLMGGRGFRGMFFMTEREFLCPMCGKICTGSFVMPPNAGTAANAAGATTVLGEWINSAVYHQAIATDFMHLCYDASVGFSSASDHPSIVDTDKLAAPREMHQVYSLVLMLSNNIRVLVEKSKLGHNIPLRDVTKLCALFVHVAAFLRLSDDRKEFLSEVFSAFKGAGAAVDTSGFAAPDSLDAFIANCVVALAADESLAWLPTVVESAVRDSMVQVHAAGPAAVAPVLAFIALAKVALTGAPINVGGGADVSLPSTAVESVATLSRYLFGRNRGEEELSRLQDSGSPGASLLAPLFRETAASRDEYIRRLTTSVLYMPEHFNQYVIKDEHELLCTVCGKTPAKPVVCLKCRKLMCLNNSTKGELFEHAVACGRGCSAFLLVKGTMPVILQTVNNRAMQLRSFFVDRYGETDEGLRRGVALILDKETAADFLVNWIMASWDHDTVALQHAWKDKLNEL